MDQLLSALSWRYAVNASDPDRMIPADTRSEIECALVLSPSSYGASQISVPACPKSGCPKTS